MADPNAAPQPQDGNERKAKLRNLSIGTIAEVMREGRDPIAYAQARYRLAQGQVALAALRWQEPVDQNGQPKPAHAVCANFAQAGYNVMRVELERLTGDDWLLHVPNVFAAIPLALPTDEGLQSGQTAFAEDLRQLLLARTTDVASQAGMHIADRLNERLDALQAQDSTFYGVPMQPPTRVIE